MVAVSALDAVDGSSTRHVSAMNVGGGMAYRMHFAAVHRSRLAQSGHFSRSRVCPLLDLQRTNVGTGAELVGSE
jgi:hypothetical protein